jgi:uncharacterized damage-inducible protein DinB
MLSDLLDYNHYANQQVICSFVEDGFRALEGAKLFSHLINAHHHWLARVQQTEPSYAIWELHEVNDFSRIDQENHSVSFKLLKTLPDLDDKVAYATSQGDKYQNSYRDIFMHVINHSTYHRGQLSRIIRKEGIVPPNTDYIFYRRDQS